MSRIKIAAIFILGQCGLALPAMASIIAPASCAQTISVPPYSDPQAVQAVQSANIIPTPANAITPMGTLSGALGTSNRYVPQDAVPLTPVQAENDVLATNCTFSHTFSRPFASASPIVSVRVVASGLTQPFPCEVFTRTTTSVTGKCFQGQTTTLNLSIVTAGLSLAPFQATTCTALPLMFIGRDPTT